MQLKSHNRQSYARVLYPLVHFARRTMFAPLNWTKVVINRHLCLTVRRLKIISGNSADNSAAPWFASQTARTASRAETWTGPSPSRATPSRSLLHSTWSIWGKPRHIKWCLWCTKCLTRWQHIWWVYTVNSRFSEKSRFSRAQFGYYQIPIYIGNSRSI